MTTPSRVPCIAAVAAILSVVLATAATATAEPSQSPAPPESSGSSEPDRFGLQWSYLYDGGAIPFVYGSAAVFVAALVFLEPPDRPRFFSSDEGGRERKKESIPDYQVGVLGALGAVGVAAFDRDARWFHVKGMVQSLATTATVTELAKNFFGRHRPSFDRQLSSEDDRKSFFSGHSSLTWTSLVYLGLYLHNHALAPWRGDDSVAWWEVPALASLAAIAVYVPYTRVEENKHFVSDVITGAAVGTGLAVGFYWFQDRRYRRALAGYSSDSRGNFALLPAANGRGIQLVKRF